MKLSSLSIFFPCLNDARVLPELLRKTYSVLPKVTKDYEVIIVNDGSTDESREVLNRLTGKYRYLKVINNQKNLGYGAALRSGFQKSTKEWVFYTDGDGQYDPRELVKLVNKLTKNTDVVNGYKLKRSDNWVRKTFGSLYNQLLHRLYDLPVSDIDCDFRLIRRSFLSRINLKSRSGIICLELILALKKAGAKFSEVGVHHYRRPFGKSEFFKAKPLLRILFDNLSFYLHNPAK